MINTYGPDWDRELDRVMKKISKGKPVSARRDWIALVDLEKSGRLTSRVAPNGQLEFLNDETPVLVGP